MADPSKTIPDSALSGIGTKPVSLMKCCVGIMYWLLHPSCQEAFSEMESFNLINRVKRLIWTTRPKQIINQIKVRDYREEDIDKLTEMARK